MLPNGFTKSICALQRRLCKTGSGVFPNAFATFICELQRCLSRRGSGMSPNAITMSICVLRSHLCSPGFVKQGASIYKGLDLDMIVLEQPMGKS